MARPGLSKHPKFRRLAVMLGSKLIARGALEYLWEVCYENGDPFIGDALDVELAAEWDGEHGKLSAALVACRFLDVLDDGLMQVHDLWDHAPEYVRNRAKREDRRRAEGKTLSEIRSEAGKRGADARWQKANDSNRMATERQIATTPAPAPAPAPAPIESTSDDVLVEAEPSTPAKPARVARHPTPNLDWVAALWNETAAATGLSQVTAFTEPRRKAAAARLREHGEDALRQVLAAPRESRFLRGENGRSNGHDHWRPNLDWFLKPANFVKTLEGAYRDAKPTFDTDADPFGDWS